jgi:hypothetical protein
MIILSNKIVIYLDFKMENTHLTEKLKKIQQLREKRMKKYNLVVCFCVIDGLPLILKVIDPDVANKSLNLRDRLLYGGEEFSTFDMRQSFSGSGELYENRSHYSSRYIVKSKDGITIEVFNGDILVYSFESAVVRPDLMESPVSNVEIKLFTLNTELIDIDNIESLIQLISRSQITMEI